MTARVKDVMTTRVVAAGKDATFKDIAAAGGRDIVAETWHVEGVVAVRDRLAYPEGQ